MFICYAFRFTLLEFVVLLREVGVVEGKDNKCKNIFVGTEYCVTSCVEILRLVSILQVI